MPVILPSSLPLHELALFAGAGGGILGGLLCGFRTVCAVEWDAYARDVLVARQNDGCLYPFPIWDDVQTFDGRPWRGIVDVVSGGFPCQDISAAGKGAGIDGERSGMWRHMARIIGEVQPRFVLVENSPMLVGRGGARVASDLASLGYDRCPWGVVGAHHAGAPHKRDRIWFVATLPHALRPDSESGAGRRGVREGNSAMADASGTGLQGSEQPGALRDERDRAEAYGSTGQCGGISRPAWEPCECCDDWWCNVHEMHTGECPCPEIDEWESDPYSVCHSAGAGLPHRATEPMGESGADSQPERSDWWATEPDLGRVAHGVAARVDRLRCLGNGQVPAVVRLAWDILKPKER
jgi:DNA (cytosine-5)-methyltransferase 1